ncbi:MAG: hypothetical protein ACFFDI_14820 [Promethearchaeota archaeon]
MTQKITEASNQSDFVWLETSKLIKNLVMDVSLGTACYTTFEKIVQQNISNWSTIHNFLLSTSIKNFFSLGYDFIRQLCLIEKRALKKEASESKTKEELRELFEKYKEIPYAVILAYKYRDFDNLSIKNIQYRPDRYYDEIYRNEAMFKQYPLLTHTLQLLKNQEEAIHETYKQFNKTPLEINQFLEKLYSQQVSENTLVYPFFNKSRNILETTLFNWRTHSQFQKFLIYIFGLSSEKLRTALINAGIAEDDDSLQAGIEYLKDILNVIGENKAEDQELETADSALLNTLKNIIEIRIQEGRTVDLSNKINRIIFINSLEFHELKVIFESLQLTVDPKDAGDDTFKYISEKIAEKADLLIQEAEKKLQKRGLAEKKAILAQIETALQNYYRNFKLRLTSKDLWRYIQGIDQNDPIFVKITRILGDPRDSLDKEIIQQKTENLLKELEQSSDDLNLALQRDRDKPKLDKFVDILLLHIFSPLGAIFDVIAEYFSWMSINLEEVRRSADLNAFQQFRGKHNLKCLIEEALTLFNISPAAIVTTLASLLSHVEYPILYKDITARSYLFRQFGLEKPFKDAINLPWTMAEEVWIIYDRLRKQKPEIEEKIKEDRKFGARTADQIFADYESILLNFQLSYNLQLAPQLLSDSHERRLNRLFKEMRHLDPTSLFQEKIGVGRKDMSGYSEVSLFNAMKGITSNQKLQNNIERILLGINKNSTTHQLSRCARELIDLLNNNIINRRRRDLKSTT